MAPQIHTLLIGIDFSDASIAGAEWVARSFAPGARIVLVHAMESRGLWGLFEGADESSGMEALEVETRRRLEELGARLGAEHVEVLPDDGAPGERLAAFASRTGADMIAVGAHRETITGGLLGSAVSSLLGAVDIPVLIAHDAPPGAPRRILAAVDQSELADTVLAWTRSLADRFDASGQVLCAVQPPGVPMSTTLFASEEEYRRARAAVVDRAFGRVVDATEAAGLVADRFSASAVYGRPEAEIALAAGRLEAELIVIGTRGHGHGEALLVGSVSRRVIEASKCPVVVVPPPSGP